MTPLVTAVVATRNRVDLLERTLRSITSQTHPELEVVVVDEASTDGTAGWLQTITGPRLSVVTNATPLGVATARNRGLEVARGTYVAFCDDDDLWAPTKIQDQLEALSGDVRWSYVGAAVVDSRLRPLRWQRCPSSDGLAARLLEVNEVPGGASGVLAERALVEQAGGFDARFVHFADWDLWVRLSLLAPAAAVDRPLLAYLRHQSMSNVPAGKYEDLVLMREKHRAERESLCAPSSDAAILQWIGETSLRAGDRASATRAYRQAAAAGSRSAWVKWGLAGVPGYLSVYDRMKRGAFPRARLAEAEAWLAPLRPPEVELIGDRRGPVVP